MPDFEADRERARAASGNVLPNFSPLVTCRLIAQKTAMNLKYHFISNI
jgi:hypothetical protein